MSEPEFSSITRPPPTDCPAATASEQSHFDIAAAFVRDIPRPICILSPDHKFLAVNRAWEAWNEATAEKVVGKPVYEVWTETTANRICHMSNSALKSGHEVALTESQMHHGRETWVKTTLFPIRHTDQTIVAVGATIDEVTDVMRQIQVRSTDIARQADQQRVMAAARCLIWSADVSEKDASEEGDPRLLTWRNSFPTDDSTQNFLPLELLPGETYESAWHRCRLATDREECDIKGTRAIRAGQCYAQEFRVRCKGNVIRWAREEVDVETVAPGASWRVVAVVTEITDRKKREAEVEDLNERLRRAMRETHHRVKNNLQVISALVDMQIQPDIDTVQVSALKRIGSYVSNLASMHDLLIQETRDHPTEDYVSIKPVFDRLEALLAGSRNSGHLNARSADIRMTSQQATSLAMLVSELVSNGFKHGGAEVNVTLDWEPGDGDAAERPAAPRAHLRVTDNGKGFSESFDPIRDANTGLDLVRSLGEWDLRGHFTFSNRTEGGACVAMDFPCPNPS